MNPDGNKLAILGGKPAFDHPLHVGRPNIGDRAVLMQRIETLLDNRWLSNGGPFEREFEAKIADMVGVKHCIAMCNATVALEIVIRALDLTGEVIVPSLTFVATAHALQWQQVTPVFADIDPATHNLDPAAVERMITPRTSGIIGVHLWGRPCDTDALGDIAERHGLRLMYDAAHAFGAGHNGRMIGGFGDAEVFSFHATKFLNAFEGGAVVTNDDALAAKMRLMRNFGFTGWDEVSYVGTNGKMTEVCAAMGITSLESIDRVIDANRANHAAYREELETIPGFTLIDYGDSGERNYQYLVTEVDATRTGISRDRLIELLWAENVFARRYFYPGCHRMEPYRSHQPHAGLLLPETEAVAGRLLVLPTGTTIDRQDIAAICGVMRLAVEQADEVNAALNATA